MFRMYGPESTFTVRPVIGSRGHDNHGQKVTSQDPLTSTLVEEDCTTVRQSVLQRARTSN